MINLAVRDAQKSDPDLALSARKWLTGRQAEDMADAIDLEPAKLRDLVRNLGPVPIDGETPTPRQGPPADPPRRPIGTEFVVRGRPPEGRHDAIEGHNKDYGTRSANELRRLIARFEATAGPWWTATVDDVTAFFDAMEEDGRADNTINSVRSRLGRFFAYTEAHGLTDTNPVREYCVFKNAQRGRRMTPIGVNE